MNTMDVNPPFTDQEKRFVLAEAIKTSVVPVERILPIFYDGSVQPDWHQMLLPHGRNLQSCINAFEALRPSQPPPPPFHTQSYQVPLPPPPKSAKRRTPPENLETSKGHDQKRRISDIGQHTSILPKPSNGSQPFGSPNTAQKKRGRPSKAAVAQRDAEAIARGEVIAPPRTSSLRAETPGGVERVSTPIYANIAPMVSPRPLASPITPASFDSPSFTSSEVTSPKRRRAPTKKIEQTPKPGETSFLVGSPQIGGERSTYPSIISSLTDTIPVSHSGESSSYRPSQPAPSLPPPISAPPPGPPPLPPRTEP